MDLAQRHPASTPTASTPTVSTPAASAPAALMPNASAPAASTPAASAPAASSASTPLAFLREPFRAATWLRFVYLLLALPVGILCVPIALVGGPAGRIQRGLARGLLGVEAADPGPDGRGGLLALAHAVISVPLNLIALAVSGYFWTVVVINLAYPLRPGGDPSQAWGGPTMAGAWAVHGLGGGVPFLLITPWVMRGFTLIQARLVKGFLGADRTGLLKTTWTALALALVCAFLSIPVIHQL
ncbi:hypothetical protein [Streptomyces sp. NPDC048361]|uniref:hypothetical protein n=1 Tax=Streptomyces sp. NPDC048361 TaxID=3154720 RepID=UPI00341A78BB